MTLKLRCLKCRKEKRPAWVKIFYWGYYSRVYCNDCLFRVAWEQVCGPIKWTS